MYIGWLCSAAFVHLPKFKALGFDIKTDVSLLLTIFLLSCLVSLSSSRHAHIFMANVSLLLANQK